MSFLVNKKKSEIINQMIVDISMEMFDIGIRETDAEIIENIAREIKVIVDGTDT